MPFVLIRHKIQEEIDCQLMGNIIWIEADSSLRELKFPFKDDAIFLICIYFSVLGCCEGMADCRAAEVCKCGQEGFPDKVHLKRSTIHSSWWNSKHFIADHANWIELKFNWLDDIVLLQYDLIMVILHDFN